MIVGTEAPASSEVDAPFVLPPLLEERERWIAWADALPVARRMGLACNQMQRGLVVTEMMASPWPLNPNGSLFGGLTLAAVDQTLGLAAMTVSAPAGIAATSSLTGQFLRPVRPPITVRGEVIRAGRVLIFLEGSVHDSEGALCARASGTWSVTESARGVMR